MWILTSSITSTKVWASSLDRVSNTAPSSRSEKIDFIRSTRSSVEAIGLINRFHTGEFLHAGKQSGQGTDDCQNECGTDESRSICKTSGASGRLQDSPSQHRCIIFHNPPVIPECAGRGGRPPWIMVPTAATGWISPNGVVPVNT